MIYDLKHVRVVQLRDRIQQLAEELLPKDDNGYPRWTKSSSDMVDDIAERIVDALNEAAEDCAPATATPDPQVVA